MAIATLTSKGQITLPMAVRTALGLEAGGLYFARRQLCTGAFAQRCYSLEGAVCRSCQKVREH